MFLFITGCAWIGSNSHRYDLAVAQVQFLGASATCAGPVMVRGGVSDPELDGVEFTLTLSREGEVLAVGTAALEAGEVLWSLEAEVVAGEVLDTLIVGENTSNAGTVTVLQEGIELYRDGDRDGYGAGAPNFDRCRPTLGWVSDDTDCDDTDENTNPNASERCAPGDQDCDGDDLHDAIDTQLWFLDADQDGFGGGVVSAPSCSPPAGYVADQDDCDDGDPAVSPNGIETCNGYDDDCDGLVDDADPQVVLPVLFADMDGDGFGGAEQTVPTCDTDGFTTVDGDCDDTTSNVGPGRIERCNEIDDDCDGAVDAQDDDLDGEELYADADGDGWGSGPLLGVGCYPLEPNTAEQNTDCDDHDPDVHPNAPEILCEGGDRDCDPTTQPQGVDYGGAHYDRPHQAIDAAVAAGVGHPLLTVCGEVAWVSNYIIRSDVEIVGLFGSDATLRGPVHVTDGATVELRGLTLSPAYGTPGIVVDQRVGGSLAVDGTETAVTIGNSTIQCRPPLIDDELVTHGGALWVADGGRIDVSSTTIADCAAQVAGGAAYVGTDGRLGMSLGVTYRNNTAPDGGAIYLDGGRLIRVNSGITVYESNHATDRGGALAAVNDADVSIAGNFMSNSAAEGGAIHLNVTSGFPNLAASTLTGNNASVRGGALVAIGANLFLDEVTFENNSAPDGGAVWAQWGELQFRPDASFAFRGNQATAGDGGALWLSGSSVVSGMHDTFEFMDNSASGAGGAIHLVGTDPQACDVALTSASFTGNRAENEGGALSIDGCPIHLDGVFTNNAESTGPDPVVVRQGVLDLGIASFFESVSPNVVLDDASLTCDTCSFLVTSVDDPGATDLDQRAAVVCQDPGTSCTYTPLP